MQTAYILMQVFFNWIWLDGLPLAWRDPDCGDSKFQPRRHDYCLRGRRPTRRKTRYALRLREPWLAQELPPQGRTPGALPPLRYRGAARRRLDRARTARPKPARRV